MIEKFGSWEIDCDLKDGARIGQLRYSGVDLLTARPDPFRPPAGDYGLYETRPVYGYDDCFPTVDVCDDWPDHGELCWLAWEGSAVECRVRSRRLPVTFQRRLLFGQRDLLWSFEAENQGRQALPVQHVMHPLMPLGAVSGIELPVCETHDSPALSRRLLSLPEGSVEMLYLNNIIEGRFSLLFRRGLRLTVKFSKVLFPTLSIWWNKNGYPDEDGLRRSECAFEPTPGPTSKLTDGTTLTLPALRKLAWQVHWEMG